MPDISSSLSKREVNARQNTYTKSEIDLKDGAIQAIAEAAQTTADAAEKKNQEQDQLIAELQKSAHTHSNKGVLDKIEQPYTTAERDKLAGLENYTHPNYTAHAKGFYKVANDGKGHVTDAGKVTKKDITDLGIPGEDTNTTYELALPTYASQKEPPSPMLSLNGSDGSKNKQSIPYAYTVLKNIEYEEFSGYAFGGNYRSIADLAFVIPYPSDFTSWRITAIIYLETRSSEGKQYYSQYSFEMTESGSSIRRNLGKDEAYSDIFAETKDWGVLDDEIFLPNPDKIVKIYRIGVTNEVFNKLTGGGCSTSRLIYHTGTNGAIARPVSYYSDISIDASSQARDNDFVYTLTKTDVSNVAFTGDYNDLSNKPTIPDISGKQDKSTAVTHSANTAVGSATKPVYVAANGVATPISHSINSDVPANAKFTDTTYNDATQSAHGLMTAADKKKLDGMDLSKYLPLSGGAMVGDIDMQTNKRDILIGTQPASAYGTFTPVSSGQITTDKKFVDLLPTMRSYMGTYNYKTASIDQWYDLISVRHRNGYGDGSGWGMMIFAPLFGGDLQWNLNTNKDKWQGFRCILDSSNFADFAAKRSHTHDMIVNNSKLIAGSNNVAQWCRLGTLTSFEDFSTTVISVWSGDGANGLAAQNSWFEIHIKDGWQSTQSTNHACGVTVYRTRCGTVKVKVIPTAHNTFTVWVYLPWGYWNGNYAVNGRYKTWTSDFKNQTAEPDGTAADTAYYDQAFLTSTVAKATEATTLTDSGWIATTRNTTFTVTSTVKCRKYGQLVEVRGEVTFNSTYGSPTVCTLPAGYRPAAVVQTCGYTPSGKIFGIKVDTAGVVSFSSDAAGTFVKSTTYRIDLTYLLG